MTESTRPAEQTDPLDDRPGQDVRDTRQDEEFVAVVAADDFWDGEMDAFDVNGREVLIVRLDGKIYAYDGVCPHQSISLVLGALDGHSLICSGHEWQFDLRTGEGINPKTACLTRHEVKIVDGLVFVSRRAATPRTGNTARHTTTTSGGLARSPSSWPSPSRSRLVDSPAAFPTTFAPEATP